MYILLTGEILRAIGFKSSAFLKRPLKIRSQTRLTKNNENLSLKGGLQGLFYVYFAVCTLQPPAHSRRLVNAQRIKT